MSESSDRCKINGLSRGFRAQEIQEGADSLGTKEGWSKDKEDGVEMGGQHPGWSGCENLVAGTESGSQEVKFRISEVS